jgi:translation initiation factor RLI1
MLSAGACQRIKLAAELHKIGNVYVMDEPTVGLHMSDIGHLLQIINRLVDSGNTVIVIEVNLEVIENAERKIIVPFPPGPTPIHEPDRPASETRFLACHSTYWPLFWRQFVWR